MLLYKYTSIKHVLHNITEDIINTIMINVISKIIQVSFFINILIVNKVLSQRIIKGSSYSEDHPAQDQGSQKV